MVWFFSYNKCESRPSRTETLVSPCQNILVSFYLLALLPSNYGCLPHGCLEVTTWLLHRQLPTHIPGRETEGTRRKGQCPNQKSNTFTEILMRLLFKTHWPEPQHMAIHSCRAEMQEKKKKVCKMTNVCSNCPESLNFEQEAVTAAWSCLCRNQGKSRCWVTTGIGCLIPFPYLEKQDQDPPRRVDEIKRECRQNRILSTKDIISIQ